MPEDDGLLWVEREGVLGIVPGQWSVAWGGLLGAPCVEDSEGSISVSADGTVHESFPGTSNKAAFTPGWFTPSAYGGLVMWTSVTYLCEVTRMQAALADYYFWWAARLLAWFEDTGDENAERVADVCVRAAMAEIAELTGLLLHELTHFTGSDFEDGGAEPFVPCQNCCHYLLHIVMRDKLMAEFGAPPPMSSSGIPINTASLGNTSPRFQWDSVNDPFSWNFGFRGQSDECGISFTSTRANFWLTEGAVRISYVVMPNNPPATVCWDNSDPSYLASTDTVVHVGANEANQGAGTNR